MRKQKISSFHIGLGVILVLVLLLGTLLVFLKPTPKQVKSIETIEIAKNDSLQKPIFRKDGELRILDAKTLQVISIIDIEVADDDHEREQGLMYRDTMAENQGMLFMMGFEEQQSFWMKNTILSLDIFYANDDKRIVSIHPNTKPFSLEQIVSAAPASLVIEVNAGYAKKYGIKVGDIVSF